MMLSSPSQIQDYRSLLREVLIEKRAKNPKFSMRRLADMVGVQASYLSMMMNGKRELTEAIGMQIAEKLKLPEEVSRKFILLIRLNRTTTPSQRASVLKELEIAEPESRGRRDLTLDQFRIIADWYHLPLQILIDMDGYEWSEKAAAKTLSISVDEVRQALERMTALEMIEWTTDRKPKRASLPVSVESPYHNEALKKYHTQMLEHAIVAIQKQDPSRRFTGSYNFAFTEDQLIKARRVLKETLKVLCQISEVRNDKKKELFHLSFNLFSLMATKEGDIK